MFLYHMWVPGTAGSGWNRSERKVDFPIRVYTNTARKGLKPFTLPGDLSARSPSTVHPSGGRCASPPWTQGPSPGAFGPHARAVTAISCDRRPRTTLLVTCALQPVAPRKAQILRSKSLNIDLSLPVRPRLAVASFQRCSHGAVRAAATLDEALSSNLPEPCRKTFVKYQCII